MPIRKLGLMNCNVFQEMTCDFAMKYFSILFAAATFTSCAASANPADPFSVPAPQLNAGDLWILEQTRDRGRNGFLRQRLDLTIERVGSDNMVVGIKPDGAPSDYVDHIAELDWSQKKIFNGKETRIGHLFSFPLSVGKTWVSDYTDPRVRGTITSLHFHNVYKVVGWEDITVQAGKFRALKMEVNGTIEAHTAATSSISGGLATTSGDAATAMKIQQSGPKIIDMLTYSEILLCAGCEIFGHEPGRTI